jgi:O-antigen ligase
MILLRYSSYLQWGLPVAFGMLCGIAILSLERFDLRLSAALFGLLSVFTILSIASSYNQISWIFIFVWMIARLVVFERRDDPAALFLEGVSTQNTIQLAITLCASVWALILLYSRRVNIVYLVNRPGLWITLLVILYMVSIAWSLWPELTLFKSIELAVFWIITIHIFSDKDWDSHLRRFLIWTVLIVWIAGFLTPGGNSFGEGMIVGGIRSNSGSLLAASLLLLVIHRSLFLKISPKLWEVAFPIISMIVFGSLASVVAFIISCLILLLFYTRPLMRPVFAILLVLSMAALAVIMPLNSLVSEVALFLGKTPEHITNLTGRTLLWTEAFEVLKHNLLGFGFAAGERTFAVLIADPEVIGWSPTNIHNGYLAAALSIGWTGTLIIFLLFADLLLQSFRLPIKTRTLVIVILVLIAINNFTIPAIGGQFTPVWVIMMALTCTSRIKPNAHSKHS